MKPASLNGMYVQELGLRSSYSPGIKIINPNRHPHVCMLQCCSFLLHFLKPLLRLAANHQVHRGEELVATTSDKAVGGEGQAVGGLLGASRRNLESLKRTSEVVSSPASPLSHAHNGEDVVDALDVAELARKRPVPREGIRAISKILVVQHLETGRLHGSETLGNLAHVGDTITLLNTEADLAVADVVVVIFLSHQPLVNTEDTTRLEHTEDLAVDALQSGGVASSLNGVDGVERVVGEGHLHEIALDVTELVRELLLLRIVCGTLNLVVVVVETSDVSAGELGNLAGRSSDTAADIKNLHALLDADLSGQVVLVAGNGLVERLSVRVAAEVEGLAPAVLVKVGREIVVARKLVSVQIQLMSLASKKHSLSGQSRVLSSTGLEAIDVS